MNERHQSVAAAAALIMGVGAAGITHAATCTDELDRFERRLHDSTLASKDPDAFQALLRRAEETAELRDERQCLQGVAELNEALPEDASAQPVSKNTGSANQDSQAAPSRPKAPVLMIAGSDGASSDESAKTGDENTDEASSDKDEENRRH